MNWLFALFSRAAPPAPVPGAPPSIQAPKAGVAGAWLGFALTMVAGFEGLYTHAYKDPVGVTTVCFGVTNVDRPVKMGDTYTPAECKQQLAEDLPKYDAMAKKCIPKLDSFPPHRHAAMVSFVYNVGQGNLCKSSVSRHLNAGRVKEGCDALLLWNKAGGKELRGLTNRRQAERKDCLRSD